MRLARGGGYSADSDLPPGERPPRDTGVPPQAPLKHRVHIRSLDDWVEIYLDGVQVHAAHAFNDLNLKELLERLGVEVSSEYCPNTQAWWEEA